MTAQQATLLADDLREHLAIFKEAYEAYKEEVRVAASSALTDLDSLAREMDEEVTKIERVLEAEALDSARSALT